MENSAIMFVHLGDQIYFDLTIQYSRKYNPDHKIIILGDESNREIAEKYGCQHFLYAAYKENWDYKHISVNLPDYEKCCFERWIVMKNWLLQHPEIEHVFHSDSDNVLLQNISFLEFCLKSYDVLSFDRSTAIIPNLFIAKRNVMIHIGNETVNFYKQSREQILEKYVFERINNTPHFSDMYLLPFLLKPFSIWNLENNYQNYCFNSNIRNSRDAWTVKNGQFILNEDKILCNIHFQGDSKPDIQKVMDLLVLQPL